MLNKKIALSAMSILASLALLGGATFALFSDTATSQDNTFSTGNADLQIAPEGLESPGTYVNDIPAPAFSGSDIAPGFDEDFVFWLKNNSTSDIDLDVVGKLADVTGDEALQDELLVMFTCTRQDGSGPVATTQKSVNAWEADLVGEGLGSLTLTDNGADGSGADEMECVMNVELPSDVGSEVAGLDTTFDGVFDGTQVAI